MAGEGIGMARVMRGIVNGFHMGKADKADNEQAKHDRRQRLRKAGCFAETAELAVFWLMDMVTPLAARPAPLDAAERKKAVEPHTIHFTTGIRD